MTSGPRIKKVADEIRKAHGEPIVLINPNQQRRDPDQPPRPDRDSNPDTVRLRSKHHLTLSARQGVRAGHGEKESRAYRDDGEYDEFSGACADCGLCV